VGAGAKLELKPFQEAGSLLQKIMRFFMRTRRFAFEIESFFVREYFFGEE
jgi:hypothetical protein